MLKRATFLFLCLNLTALSAQETIARVTKMRGEVRIKGLNAAAFSPTRPGAAITSGDVLSVGAESFCMVDRIREDSVRRKAGEEKRFSR